MLFSNCKTVTTLTVESKKPSSKEIYNPDEIIVIVELKINKGSDKEILEFCERYKNEVDKVEPNALGWSFFNSEDNKVTLIERYKNSEANLTHVDLFVSEIKFKFSNLLFFFSDKNKFKFFIPGKPNNSNNLIFFPISSASPQLKPAALLALFDTVSISLRDLILNLGFINPLLIIIF